jgi:cobalt/nickel transport system permease protein
MIAAAAFASWCATVLTAIACAGQLAFAGTTRWGLGFPTITGVHMVIGLGEGLITALVISAIARVRPELVAEAMQPTIIHRAGEFIGLGLLVALGLAVFVAPFACPWPDGLEKAAGALGFEHRATDTPREATAITATAGTLVAFGLSLLLARLLTPKPNHGTQLSRPV